MPRIRRWWGCSAPIVLGKGIVNNYGARSRIRLGRITMNALRKQALHNGLPVAYADEVSEEQVRKINELVQGEFVDNDWVTVEQES